MLQKLRACAGFRREGDLQNALRAASDACHEAPECWQPHYAYGEIWLALNEPARAAEAFAAALRLDPANADAWINYGLARLRQGALEDAKTAMRRVLRQEPEHPVRSGQSRCVSAPLWRGRGGRGNAAARHRGRSG